MSSTRPLINPDELQADDVVEMEDDPPVVQRMIEDQQRMLPIADAPRNGLPLANGDVPQSSTSLPGRVQPANPPSAQLTPTPYANMSPLPGQGSIRAARSQEEIVAYGPSRSGRSTRRALEYIASPDKETVKRELEEQRIETRRLTEELEQAAKYNGDLRASYHEQAESALRHQQQEFELSSQDFVNKNQTMVRLQKREYEAQIQQQNQEFERCREAVLREMAAAQHARQFEATQAQFEHQAQRFCQQAADSEQQANDLLVTVIDQGKQLHRELTTVKQHEQQQAIILVEAAEHRARNRHKQW